MRLLVLERGAYEAADESANHGRAKHAPIVVVEVAVVVAAVVVVILPFRCQLTFRQLSGKIYAGKSK